MTVRVLLLAADRPDPEGLGGVQLHTAALVRHAPVYTVYPRAHALWLESWNPRRVVAALPVGQPPDNPLADWPLFEDALMAAIIGTEAQVLHVHSLHLAPRAVVSASRRSGVRLLLTLHNHALVCENYELLERGERYCGIPEDPARCDRCLAQTRRRPPGHLDEWRRATGSLAALADAIVAPSESALEHAARVHPRVRERAEVIPWGVPRARAQCRPAADSSTPLRVAIVGMFEARKGAEELPALLEACRHLHVDWHLFGATEGASQRSVLRAAPRVTLHGAYKRSSLSERLAAAQADVAILPSIFPETFSLALSEVTQAGLPVLGCRIGAVVERIEREELGWSFDPHEPSDLARQLESLCRDRRPLVECAERLRARPHRDEDAMAVDHLRLWERLASLGLRESVDPAARADAEARFASAARHVPAQSRLEALIDTVRKTDFYRDFPLRRLLSPAVRRSVERLAARASSRAGRT